MLGLSTVWIPKLHCILTSFVHEGTQCFVEISTWKMTAHNLENASSVKYGEQRWRVEVNCGLWWPYCDRHSHYFAPTLRQFDFCCILTFFVLTSGHNALSKLQFGSRQQIRVSRDGGRHLAVIVTLLSQSTVGGNSSLCWLVCSEWVRHRGDNSMTIDDPKWC